MPDGEQVLSDKPERLIGGHPATAVEAGEVHWIGKSAQRAFAAKIEIDLEIAHRQLTQATIYRLAVAASGVVGLRDCAPVPVFLEDGNDVVSIVLGLQINHERPIAINAQCSGREHRSFKAVRSVLA